MSYLYISYWRFRNDSIIHEKPNLLRLIKFSYWKSRKMVHFSADGLHLRIGNAICADHHKYNLSHNICLPNCSGSSQSSTLQLVWRRLGFSSSNDYSKPPSSSANQPEVVLVGNDLYGSNNSYGKEYSKLSQTKLMYQLYNPLHLRETDLWLSW